MTESTMVAYAEVDSILGLMDESYIMAIPEKIREIFKKYKSKDHRILISTIIPLEEQNLSQETYAILASLNYNYWCKDEERKRNLLESYKNNEIKFQGELREKYNPDVFAANREKVTEQENIQSETTTEVEKYKESIFRRIINKIKAFFSK